MSRDRKVASGESSGLSVLLSWEGLYQISSLSSGVLEIEGKELLIPMITVGPKDQWGSETVSVPPPQCPVSNFRYNDISPF